jgi:uncharacterized membrane protein YfcA
MGTNMIDSSIAGLIALAAAMAATGIVGGILAGLLGVGGGIVIVPVLAAAFQFLGIADGVIMHCAVATSLASIILTALSSARAHRAKGAVDAGIIRLWTVPLGTGAIAGVALAAAIETGGMRLVFGAIAILIAVIIVATPDDLTLRSGLPRGPAGLLPPFSIGALSALIGIGGGVMSVPFLSACAVPVRTAVGTSSVFGLIIALPAAVTFIYAGWDNPDLPPVSLGYVNLIGLALLTPFSVLAAPWGARIAHAIPPRSLRFLFAVFLIVAAANMFYAALS